MKLRTYLPASLLILQLTCSAVSQASPMTIDLTKRGGPLKKGGLGSLFGVGAVAGPLPAPLLDNSILWITSHQGRVSDHGSDPFSTDSVAPIIRGTDIKMMCRLNDLLPGFEPYGWNGLADWDSQVTAAIEDITANYADVVYAVEVFNEPDREWYSSAFANDPAVQGSGVDARINWLWTHTVKEIKAINPSLKIMGPNYQSYQPEYSAHASDQPRMQNFLQNALSTGTMPDVIGWHSLYNNEPADIGNSLGYYRQLETQLSIPNAPLPISINEYGVNNGAFEGIPGKAVQFWGEMERDRIDFGGEGVYTNYGELGNTVRYPWSVGQKTPQPNGGWFMQNWYNQMKGVYVPVSAASTRYDLAYDGVASYDAASQSVTVILGGSDDDADITFNGLDQVGLAGNVRVRVDATFWTVDPSQNDQRPERGGDPQTATYNILDTTMSSGATLTLPIHKLDHNNGYRVVISPAATADPYPTKYEAESSTLQGASIQQAAANVSGGQYVSGIAQTGSSATFNVAVETGGTYLLYARYATATAQPASQTVSVNGASQGSIAYPPTNGGPAQEFDFAAKRVVLNAGTNAVTLAFNTGAAALDYIDVRPDTHRYQAAYAAINAATLYSYFEESIAPDYVGGLNDTSAYVDFAIDAPQEGIYSLAVNYANGISGGDAIDDVFVNSNNAGQINLPYTGHFTGGVDPGTAEQTATTQVALNQGVNFVRLQKNTLYAELDYATITPMALSGAPALSITPPSLTFPTQPQGTTSAPQSFTLSNVGSAAIAISSVQATGDFAVTSGCGSSIAPGASCQGQVTFTPASTGARTGTVTIASSAGGSPNLIGLTGSSTAPYTISIASGSSASASVASGQAGTYNLVLTAAPGVSGTVQLTCLGLPANATCAISPMTAALVAGSPTPVSVKISTGTAMAALRFGSGGALSFAALLFAPLLLLRDRRGAAKQLFSMSLFAVTCVLFVTLGGCGGSGRNPASSMTPQGTYTITISATGVFSSASQTLTLLVS